MAQRKRGGQEPSSAPKAVGALEPGVRRNHAEQAMVFAERAGGEEQRVGWTARAAVAKKYAPQAIDLHRQAGHVLHVANPGAVGGIECRDQPAAEVADEQVAGKALEGLRRHRDPPRRVEIKDVGSAEQQVSLRI